MNEYQKALDYLWKVSNLHRKSTGDGTVKSLRLFRELIEKESRYGWNTVNGFDNLPPKNTDVLCYCKGNQYQVMTYSPEHYSWIDWGHNEYRHNFVIAWKYIEAYEVYGDE